jgi:hypothetical protein
LQRGDVGAEEDIRDDGLSHQVGALRLHAVVGIAANVAVWPTVKAAVLDGSEIVGREIVAKFIALIHGGPHLAGDRLQRQTYRVAQSGGVLPGVLAVGIANGDCGAHGLLAGADIGFGADADEDSADFRLGPGVWRFWDRI